MNIAALVARQSRLVDPQPAIDEGIKKESIAMEVRYAAKDQEHLDRSKKIDAEARAKVNVATAKLEEEFTSHLESEAQRRLIQMSNCLPLIRNTPR